MRTDLRRRRLRVLAAAAVVAAAAVAARAQLTGAAQLILELPFFAGGGGPSSGGTMTLTGSVGADGGALMTGGTLSLVPVLEGGRAPAAPPPAAPAAASDLASAHAFPVPYKPALGHDRITFRGLTRSATIRIYTIAGQLVQTLTKDDPATADLVWMPVADSSGRTAASGVYLYTITGDSGRSSGKIMIVR
jgi:hypothetical protein